MADKKIELDPKTQDPKFMYHLTQEYMKGYVQAKASKADQIWFYKLVLSEEGKKQVTRGGKTFDVLDQTYVRNAFAKKFFPELLENKKKKGKPSYFDEIAALLADLEK